MNKELLTPQQIAELEFWGNGEIDWEMFFDAFDGEPVRTMNKLRTQVRLENKMSIEEFTQKFQSDKKEALEELFKEPINEIDLSLTDEIEIDKIYYSIDKRPSTPFIPLMKNINFIDHEYGEPDISLFIDNNDNT